MPSPTLVLTPPGEPTFNALRERISAIKADDALSRATIVVPSNYVGVATRRAVAAAGVAGRVGLAGVTFLTVYRLAELLGASVLARSGRKPVSTPVLTAAIRRRLREDPGVFGPVAGHVATEQALVRAFRELADIEERDREILAEQSRRAGDAVRICEEARFALSGDWYDEADLIVAGCQVLETGTPVLDDLGEVIVYLPRRMRRRPGSLLAAFGSKAPMHIVASLTPGLGVSTDLRRSLELLGAAIPDAPTPPPLPSVDLVRSASDADDEVRAALRTVVNAVRDGTPLDRIAVVHASPDPYTRLVHDHFSAAEVEHNGTAVRSVAERMTGRFLLGVLRLAERRWRRDEVIGLIAGAPTRQADGSHAPSARWEEASRAAGVVAGLDDWDLKLRRHALECRATAIDLEDEPEPRQGRIDHLRREADAAEELRSFVLELADRLATAPSTWRDLASWASQLLADLLGTDRMRASWPKVEQEAATRIEESLDRLAGLDEVDDEAGLDTFARTLELELDSDLGRQGVLGRGVLTGRIDDALGLDLDLLVVLGLAEGSFPARRLDDSLFPDRERTAARGALRTRSDDQLADLDDLYRAVAATERVVCSFPRGDLRRTSERVPSRWLLDLIEAQREAEGESGWCRELPPPSSGWFDEIPSFAGSIERVVFGGSHQEQRLAVLTTHARAGRLEDHPVVANDDIIASGVDLVLGRASRDFTRFDGNLVGLAVPSPADAGSVMGSTRLENFVKNPHRYLMETILKVQLKDDPELEHKISPIEYGNVVHHTLERFFEEVIGAGDLPDAGKPWDTYQIERLLRVAEECWAEQRERGLVGRPAFEHGDRRRFDADIRRFVTEDNAFRAENELVPIAAELSFGMADSLPPVEFALASGRTVRFRGSADRVDRSVDGRIFVTDYKTGSNRQFKGIEPSAPTAGGTKLQLPVYALAGRAHVGDDDAGVHARYWFVTEKHDFDEIGYDVDEAAFEEFAAVLDTIVTEIEAGHFPMRPPEPVWRPFVEDDFADPDGLGTADRWRDWDRLRTHPDLARFVELAEGIPEEDS